MSTSQKRLFLQDGLVRTTCIVLGTTRGGLLSYLGMQQFALVSLHLSSPKIARVQRGSLPWAPATGPEKTHSIRML
jgi:hypothetical protein